MVKLGSLFDGIGTFPLSGLQFGFAPIWASEIEAFPIAVTKHHFPDMKHLGDITKINGAEIEPVDVITFGSPCQDMSVAGKREGLCGARSGLFMEAVRIIREMRTATSGQYPRFAVWENVPGAFSSNKGEDFRAVLEEICEAEIPMPESGKWAEAGMVRTERVDVAWRTLDAQHWGVPQRRRRIFLVADFRGQCAGEILFIEPCLSWNFEKGREKGQEAAGDVGTGLAVTVRMREGCAGGDKGPLISEGKSLTLGCNNDQTVFASYWDGGQISDCLDCSMLAKGQMMPEKRRFPAVLEPQLYDMTHADELSATIQAKPNGGQSLNYINPVRIGYAVRRLTPTECERLQGLPDGWTNIVGAKDTNRYKAIGNGIAKPCSDFVLGGIVRVTKGGVRQCHN